MNLINQTDLNPTDIVWQLYQDGQVYLIHHVLQRQ